MSRLLYTAYNIYLRLSHLLVLYLTYIIRFSYPYKRFIIPRCIYFNRSIISAAALVQHYSNSKKVVIGSRACATQRLCETSDLKCRHRIEANNMSILHFIAATPIEIRLYLVNFRIFVCFRRPTMLHRVKNHKRFTQLQIVNQVYSCNLNQNQILFIKSISLSHF